MQSRAMARLHNTDGRCGPRVLANDAAGRASKRVIARKNRNGTFAARVAYLEAMSGNREENQPPR